MKSLTQFIKEEASNSTVKNAKKSMEDFGEFLFDNKSDEKSGVPQLLNFCKKVFGKRKKWDEVIHYKNTDLQKTLLDFVKKSDENEQEFKQLYEKIIDANFSDKNIKDIYATYTLSHNDVDIFVLIVFFAFRYINDFKDTNILEK